MIEALKRLFHWNDPLPPHPRPLEDEGVPAHLVERHERLKRQIEAEARIIFEASRRTR